MVGPRVFGARPGCRLARGRTTRRREEGYATGPNA
jgi:hypothetical protein